MSSRRSRSPGRDRSRSDSPEPQNRLPGGAEPISEQDYFLKSAEFRVWLKDEKRKYFDELTGEKARKYFRKFVKDWNRGKLSKDLYAGIDPTALPAQSQTAYKWSFASSRSKAERQALEATRSEISALTNNGSNGASSARIQGPSLPGRSIGPTLPSSSDLTLARELQEEAAWEEKSLKRKRDKREAKERDEDVNGPREVGRERLMEKKREKREGDKAFREAREDAGLELDEGTLMGGGDSFQDRIRQRDAARKRFEEKKRGPRDDRMAETSERVTAIREKDKATMDMFMQMAKARYG
ncbi:uncharacterized protein STEHIDRAFT_101856 [Stereum hirsutum FP-91666 SS1]|uniref:uncharacterized protein n=1 Tax=Stereum hirsutum (strain FP-91666) TaxID=721885 RepID=UPI000444A5A5|nr:uncharacterized protein STEHIDRAFT_101856 [Stereum hirsutum FP-91666 SS1]EIM83565.1 hypothetical protein STEHIDRAFT_101856 [Stereum hirsutum FP-91666 SS1]